MNGILAWLDLCSLSCKLLFQVVFLLVIIYHPNSPVSFLILPRAQGTNIDLLLAYMSMLRPRYFDPEAGMHRQEQVGAGNEFDIDEVFQVWRARANETFSF
jgi:hypothetical protein